MREIPGNGTGQTSAILQITFRRLKEYGCIILDVKPYTETYGSKYANPHAEHNFNECWDTVARLWKKTIIAAQNVFKHLASPHVVSTS